MGRFVQLCLCVVWLHYMIFCALSAAVCKLLTVVGDRFRVLVPSCTGHRSTYFVFDHGESIRFHKIGQNTLASPCTDQWAKSVEVALFSARFARGVGHALEPHIEAQEREANQEGQIIIWNHM